MKIFRQITHTSDSVRSTAIDAFLKELTKQNLTIHDIVIVPQGAAQTDDRAKLVGRILELEKELKTLKAAPGPIKPPSAGDTVRVMKSTTVRKFNRSYGFRYSMTEGKFTVTVDDGTVLSYGDDFKKADVVRDIHEKYPLTRGQQESIRKMYKHYMGR
ncbi:MAG: hypothetical protein WC284_16835 [Candidimonas sp.]